MLWCWDRKQGSCNWSALGTVKEEGRGKLADTDEMSGVEISG